MFKFLLFEILFVSSSYRLLISVHPSIMSYAQQQPVYQQPMGTQGMSVMGGGGNKNAKNLPVGADGREWSYGLCSCCSDAGTCKLPPLLRAPGLPIQHLWSQVFLPSFARVFCTERTTNVWNTLDRKDIPTRSMEAASQTTALSTDSSLVVVLVGF